jgi:hypothetical protein
MSQGCAPDVALSGIYDRAPSDEELLPYEQPQQSLLQIKNEPCNSNLSTNTIKVKSEDISSSTKKLNKISKKSKKIKKKDKKSKSKKEKKRRKHKKKSSSSESSSDSDSSSSSSDSKNRERDRKKYRR